MTRVRTGLIGTVMVTLMLSVTACSVEDAAGITAETTCEDYIAQEQTVRHDAAMRVSSEVDGVSSPGNPMWGLSLDAACGSAPSMMLGEYFDPQR